MGCAIRTSMWSCFPHFFMLCHPYPLHFILYCVGTMVGLRHAHRVISTFQLQCASDCRRALSENVVVVGGITALPGFKLVIPNSWNVPLANKYLCIFHLDQI